MFPYKAGDTGHDDRTELPTTLAIEFLCISLTDDVGSPGYTASNDSIENGWKGCGCGLLYCTIPSSAGNTEENYVNMGYLMSGP